MVFHLERSFISPLARIHTLPAVLEPKIYVLLAQIFSDPFTTYSKQFLDMPILSLLQLIVSCDFLYKEM